METEIQDQLPLEDRKTILRPAPRHQEPSPEEEWEELTTFQKIKRIMGQAEDHD